MSALPHPPAEPPVIRDTHDLAPKFREALTKVLFRLGTKGWHPVLLETIRTDARQRWLYGMGRDYDDGRGVVTQADTAMHGWHFFGLAADVAEAHHADGSAPARFYTDLHAACVEFGLTSGADWNRNGIADEHHPDRPHVQWYCEGMHVSPSDHAAELHAQGGNPAVWAVLHAN